MYVCMHMQTRIYTLMYDGHPQLQGTDMLCVYIHIHIMYVCIYIHTLTHICMTHIHTHTHTYTLHTCAHADTPHLASIRHVTRHQY